MMVYFRDIILAIFVQNKTRQEKKIISKHGVQTNTSKEIKTITLYRKTLSVLKLANISF